MCWCLSRSISLQGIHCRGRAWCCYLNWCLWCLTRSISLQGIHCGGRAWCWCLNWCWRWCCCCLGRGVEPILAHAALALDGLLSWPAVLSPLWPTPRSLLTALFVSLFLLGVGRRSPTGLFPLRRWPVTLLITLRRACGIPARLTARLPRHWVGTVLGRIPEVCAQRRGLLRPRCGSTFVR